MAVKPPINVTLITQSLNSIGRSLFNVKKSAIRSEKILLNRTKIKGSFIRGDKEKFQRNREVIRRRERKGILEASRLGQGIGKPFAILANASKGFLQRILDFAATLLTGWLLNNLPTIIQMARELIGRIQRLMSIFVGFIGNIRRTFFGYLNLLDAVFNNITSFDFFDTSKRVESAMGELDSAFYDMEGQINEGLSLITTPLTQGMTTEEDAAPFGTDYTRPDTDTLTPGSVPGGTLGTQQLVSLARGAGFTPDEAVIMAAIAKAESGGKSGELNNNPKTGDLSYGLWQINMIGSLGPARLKEFGISRYEDLFDPATNAKAAYKVYKSSGYGSWSVYRPVGRRPPKYLQFLPEAQKYRSAQPITRVESSQPSVSPLPIDQGKRFNRGDVLTKTIGRGVDYVQITDLFGSRGGSHKGLDIAAPNGTYIALRYDCEVVAAGSYGNYGNTIDVWVPQLGVQLRMAHLSSILIKSGKIKAGMSFARVGSTGRSTGPHIHFEYDTRRGGTTYGGSGDPSPYVSTLLLTRTPNQGSFAVPEISGAPTSTPTAAEVSMTPSPLVQMVMEQLMATERKGPQIIMIDDAQPMAQQSSMMGGGSGGTVIPIIINPLNSFITKKFLLDLAYT
jgi:murein DD-endopeptidase MepM/ murein hydrolase activator NlpD